MNDDLTLKAFSCVRSGDSYILTNPRSLSGWQDVRVTRGIEMCPSNFQITMTDVFPDGSSPAFILQPGDYCQVYLGADLVITGWIDQLLPEISMGSHQVMVTGRGKCQDIVDCAAVWNGNQFTLTPTLTIAQSLCKPFGISVSLAPGTDQGAVIPQIVIIAGETAYDVIERLCRFRAMLLYDTPTGDLLISGIGSGNAASGFQEGVNIVRAAASFSADQRFSDYYAIYQGLDLFSDLGTGGNTISHLVDPTVQRYRPHVIISESVAGGAVVAEQRAQWELARRWGRSFSVRLTTDSWRDSNGALYTPNTFAPLYIPTLKLGTLSKPVTWIIAQVSYSRGMQGTLCDLVMMPKEAFYQQPIILTPFAPDVVVSE